MAVSVGGAPAGLYFRPPTSKRYHASPRQDRLMSRVPYNVGLAVVDNGGVLTPYPGKEVVPQDEWETATHVYAGGYIWGPLSDGEILNLKNAGYGAFLSATPP